MYGERGKAFYGQDPANGARRRRCQYEKARAVKPGSSFAARAEDTPRAASSYAASTLPRTVIFCRFACCPSSAKVQTRMQLIGRAAPNNVDIGRGYDIDLGVLGVLIGDELNTVG